MRVRDLVDVARALVEAQDFAFDWHGVYDVLRDGRLVYHGSMQHGDRLVASLRLDGHTLYLVGWQQQVDGTNLFAITRPAVRVWDVADPEPLPDDELRHLWDHVPVTEAVARLDERDREWSQ